MSKNIILFVCKHWTLYTNVCIHARWDCCYIVKFFVEFCSNIRQIWLLNWSLNLNLFSLKLFLYFSWKIIFKIFKIREAFTCYWRSHELRICGPFILNPLPYSTLNSNAKSLEWNFLINLFFHLLRKFILEYISLII